MNDQDLARLFTRAAGVLSITAAVIAVGFFITAVVKVYPGAFIAGLILCILSGGLGYVSIAVLGKRVGAGVFNSQIERELLNRKQRKHLRDARGGLVMQRALVEVEQERENITHRELEAAEDPNKPPHPTRFSGQGDSVRRLEHSDDWPGA